MAVHFGGCCCGGGGGCVHTCLESQLPARVRITLYNVANFGNHYRVLGVNFPPSNPGCYEGIYTNGTYPAGQPFDGFHLIANRHTSAASPLQFAYRFDQPFTGGPNINYEFHELPYLTEVCPFPSCPNFPTRFHFFNHFGDTSGLGVFGYCCDQKPDATVLTGSHVFMKWGAEASLRYSGDNEIHQFIHNDGMPWPGCGVVDSDASNGQITLVSFTCDPFYIEWKIKFRPMEAKPCSRVVAGSVYEFKVVVTEEP